MNTLLAAFAATVICAQCEDGLRPPTDLNVADVPGVVAARVDPGTDARDPEGSSKLDLAAVLISAARAAPWSGGPRTGQGEAAEPPVASDFVLAGQPPRPSRRVSLLMAVQKTATPRATDTPETARKEHLRSVAHMVWFRTREDQNFVNRTLLLGQRMEQSDKGSPEFAYPTTGAELLAALVEASRKGVIANLVIYGHAAPSSLYMREDRGFYRSVAAVAAKSPLASGAEAEDDNEAVLRALGARDLADLQSLVASGEIRFAKDAVIVIAGCAAGGERDVEPTGMGARLAEISGATVFASVGVTDQSMAGRHGSAGEYSRGTWAKFVKGAPPEKLNTRILDALERVVPDDGPSTVTSAPVRPASLLPLQGFRHLECAALDRLDLRTSRNPSCGLGLPADSIADLSPDWPVLPRAVALAPPG